MSLFRARALTLVQRVPTAERSLRLVGQAWLIAAVYETALALVSRSGHVRRKA
jgi:hypothetical protein